jgi:hypothetical protein
MVEPANYKGFAQSKPLQRMRNQQNEVVSGPNLAQHKRMRELFEKPHTFESPVSR